MAAITLILSGGPHGGAEHTFESDAPGTMADLPSERPKRIERYEIRQAVDAYGEPVDGEVMAIFIGTVRV
jgi:hypothetical protein